MCQHPAITALERYGDIYTVVRCDICENEADPPRLLDGVTYCDSCIDRVFSDYALDLLEFLDAKGIKTSEEACKEFIETCYREMEERI